MHIHCWIENTILYRDIFLQIGWTLHGVMLEKMTGRRTLWKMNLWKLLLMLIRSLLAWPPIGCWGLLMALYQVWPCVYFWGRTISWAMFRCKESMLQVWWFPWELPMTSTLAWSPMDGLSTNDLVPSLMLYGLFISHCRRPPIRAVEFTDVLVPGQQ